MRLSVYNKTDRAYHEPDRWRTMVNYLTLFYASSRANGMAKIRLKISGRRYLGSWCTDSDGQSQQKREWILSAEWNYVVVHREPK